MHRAMTILLVACAAASCATAPPGNTYAPLAAPAVLRLLAITPRDGAQVDSGSVLVARLAYHIPDFDSTAIYVVSAVFARVGGGTFNRGGGHARIRSPAGVVTVRHSLDALLTGGSDQLTSPLTGSFFLLEQEPLPTTEQTIQMGDQVRIRSSMTRSPVRARSRTFFFNGPGPARSLASDLPDLLEEYGLYRPHKALAVAYDSASSWTYGYAYGFASADGAVERALEECRAGAERQRIATACRILAVDQQDAEPQ